MQETGALFDQVLGEAGHLLQGLSSNEMIGLYVIQDDRFAYVSPRLADLFGYSQEALCGGMGPMDLTSPEHRALAQGEIDRRVRGETRTGHYRFHACRKDGSIFDAEVFGVATQYFGRPAIVGILVDVSERCDAERAVQDQLRLIVQLLDTIPNPVYYKDEKGRYLGCNKAFEQFVGIERERLVGRTVYDIAPGQAADRYFAA
ncbi:MAG TPA: PAS domain S-box protein, partial [Rhodocyclaceae bacterium]